MSDPALELLRPGEQRTIESRLAPEDVLRRILAFDKTLRTRVDGSTFSVAPAFAWGGTYPGSIEGVVEGNVHGSRIRYVRTATPGVRMVLSVWAVISGLVLVLSAGMAVEAIVAGEYLSAVLSLWFPLILILVWMNWRRVARKGDGLEKTFTQLVTG